MQKTLIFIFILLFSTSAYAASVWDDKIQKDGKSVEITVYHDPNCGCCTSWISHLEKHGFSVVSIKDDNMDAIKLKHHIPTNMQSCHTAIIGDYVIEGHVPANDIKALLRSKDKSIYGLSVPEMPVGTPGMEMGTRKDPFAVVSFDKSGKPTIYKTYQSY